VDLIVHNRPLKDGGGHLRLALVRAEVVVECHWLAICVTVSFNKELTH
jgi:hypothetical protein